MISKPVCEKISSAKNFTYSDKKIQKAIAEKNKTLLKRKNYLRYKIKIVEERRNEYLEEYQNLVAISQGQKRSHTQFNYFQSDDQTYFLKQGLLGGAINQQQEQIFYDIENSELLVSQPEKESLTFNVPLPEENYKRLKNLSNIQFPRPKQLQHRPNLIIKNEQNEDLDYQETGQTTYLVQLINKSLNASKKTQGKDVVFLIGKTGSGKSTIVHFLSGIKIRDKAQKQRQQGFNHVPKLSFDRTIQGFEVGDNQHSQTKEVNVIKTQNFHIVDTAGLSDTNGHFYDLANTIGLQKSLHNAKSVRMLLLIKQATVFADQKKTTLVKFVTELVGYIKNIPIQKFIQTVTILITHPNHSAKNFAEKLKKILQAEKNNQIIIDKQQRPKVLKFIQALIQGAQLDAKRAKIKKITQEFQKIKNKITQLNEEVQDSGINQIKKKIIDFKQSIQELEQIINQEQNKQKQSIESKSKKLDSLNDRLKKEKLNLQKQQNKLKQKTKQNQKCFNQIQQQKKKLDVKKNQIISQQQQLKITVQKNKSNGLNFNDFISFPYTKLIKQGEYIHLVEILKSSPKIQKTKQIFQMSIKNQLKNSTEKMVYKILVNLHNVIKQYKFKMAQQKFDQITYLNYYIPTQTLKKNKQDCQRLIKNSIEQICKTFRKILDDSMSQKGVLTKDGIQQMFVCLNNLNETQSLIKKLQNFDVTSNSRQGLIKYLIKKFQLIINYASKSLESGQNIKQIGFTFKKLQKIYISFGFQYQQIYMDYITFVKKTFELLSSRIEKAKFCIIKGQYKKLAQYLNFIQKFEENIIISQFEVNVSEKYKSLIQECNISIDYRCNIWLKKVKALIDINVMNLQQQYMKLYTLSKETQLNKHLKCQTLDKYVQKAQLQIINHCFKQISFIKKYIFQNNFDKARDHFTLLDEIRKIDQKILFKTENQYAKFRSQLQRDIFWSSDRSIKDLMKKVKIGSASKIDVDELKINLDKLNKMKWLQEIIKCQGVNELLQKTNNQLLKQVTEICQGIQNTFYTDLSYCQQNRDRENLYDDQYSETELQSSRKSSYRKNFRRLNSAIVFTKILGDVSLQLSDHSSNLKKRITNLIQAQLQKVKNSVSQNKKNFTLHKIQIERYFIKLTSMKDIEMQLNYKIQDALQILAKNLVNYFQECYSNIQKLDIAQNENIKNYVSTCAKLFSSLSSCQKNSIILNNRNLVIKQFKEKLIQILLQKFEQFFDVIIQQLFDKNLQEANQSLKKLKQYRHSEVNILLDNQIKQKYDEYFALYNSKLSQIPQNINKLLQKCLFDQLKEEFEELKKNKNNNDFKNIKLQIKSTIQSKSQSILEQLQVLSSYNQKTFADLNQSIKTFNKYKEIQSFVSEVNYQMKLQRITFKLKQTNNHFIQRAKKNIENLSFNKIKNDIDCIVNFHSIMLNTVQYKDCLKLDKFNVQEQLKRKVEEIIGKQLTNQWELYFRYLDKFRVLDKQLQRQNSYHKEYKIKITNHLNNLCYKIKDGLKKSKGTKQLDSLQSQLNKLKNEASQQLLENGQFRSFLTQMQNLERIIQDSINLYLNNNIYSLEYFYRLKQQDTSRFNQHCKEMLAQYNKVKMQVDEILKNKNYKQLSTAYTQLQKFIQIGGLINFGQKQNPKYKVTQIKNSLFSKLQNHSKLILYNLEQPLKFNSQNLQPFNEYFNILLYVKFAPQQKQKISNQAKIVHQKILQVLKNCITKIDSSNANVVQVSHKNDFIKKHNNFIQLLKKYISINSSENQSYSQYFKDHHEFITEIMSLQQLNQSQEEFKSLIQQSPLKIKQFWEKNKFKQIIEYLMNFKQIKKRESNNKFEQLIQLIRNLINDTAKFIQDKVKDKQFIGLNEKMNKLRIAEQELKNIQGLIIPGKSSFQQVKGSIINNINKNIVEVALSKINSSQSKEINIKQIYSMIIELKNWMDNLPILQPEINKYIQSILTKTKAQRILHKIKCQIQQNSSNRQNNSEATTCNQILHTFSKQLEIPRCLPKLTMNVKDVIEKFKGQGQKSIDKKQLLNFYQIYNQQYNSLRQKYLQVSTKERITQNLKTIKSQVSKSIQKIKGKDKLSDFKKNVSILLARLSIYFSIKKTGQDYYTAVESGRNDASQFLIQPHETQVLSILRFIGCGKQEGVLKTIENAITQFFSKLDKLENHIMQIKTGEGKSIILGMMCLMLSLMGNDVYCVCYSTYLSSRDFEYFKQIFQDFNVTDRINYGTFSEISEMIINKKGNIRQLVANLFTTNKSQIGTERKEQQQKGNSILLVDEVDTFFSKQFYGNTYNPCVTLKNSNLIKIIKSIWANRNENDSRIQEIIKESDQYKNLSNEYKDCMSRVYAHLKMMIRDVKNFKSRDYVVVDNKIGYKQLDGVSFNTVFGYETMFLYLNLSEHGNINEQTLNQNLGINISCGIFSYAEMIDKFDKIFGVTGTLENLNKFQQNILNRYKISLKTFAPSMYGDSNRQEKSILIENDLPKYHQKISQIIIHGLNNKRSLLIFFQNEVSLTNFTNSSYAERFKEGFQKDIHIVTEKTDDRDHFIKKATLSGRVTLFTASYGRGTDFVVHDPIIKEIGVDVIQTFLSQQINEQIQIKGRTARQGSKGTYQLILNLMDLTSKFGITNQMILKARQTTDDSITNLLKRKRQSYIEKVNKERQQKLQETKKAHNLSMQKRDQILKKKIYRNDQFFFRSHEKTRICIAIDSTGSMGMVIQAVKGKVMQMIERLAKQYPNQFQIQIMFYYGFLSYDSNKDSTDWKSTNKLHRSPWSDNTVLLKQFLKNAKAQGGNSHESIEVALHHIIKCYQQVNLQKAILIGDAGLQGKLDSSLNYQVHPDDAYRYSAKTAQKPLILVFSQLLDQLKKYGISVDTYPIGNGQQMQTTCKQISDATNGKTTPFNPQKDNLAAEIEATITQCIQMKK